MTHRICLIGNSHLVALQQALTDHPAPWAGVDMQFVPFRGTTVLETRIEDGRLRPESETARTQMEMRVGTLEVDLAAADAVVVVGLNVKAQHVQTFWKEARWPALPSVAAAEDLASMEQTLLSDSAALAGVSGYLATFCGFEFAARVARTVDRPVVLIGHPRLHQQAKFQQTGKFFGLGRAIASGDAPRLSALYAAACEAVAAQHGIAFLHQPPQTVHQHLMTRGAYMAGEIEVNQPDGSRRLRQDLSHPNARYGALMLGQLAEVLAA